MKWFNYNALVNIEPFQGSRQRCYFIPQVALVVIHIQPLRGFRQFFSRPYLKGGVEIKHLAMQFDCSETIIEQILHNKGIEIVNNEIPKRVNFLAK